MYISDLRAIIRLLDNVLKIIDSKEELDEKQLGIVLHAIRMRLMETLLKETLK